MDFNDLFILECFYFKEDRDFFDMYTIPSLKDFNLSTRYQFLKKNEYLIEDPNDTSKFIVSVKGQDLYNELSKPPVAISAITAISIGKTPDECFDEWWKTFPTTTSWTTDDKNTKFLGSRNIKNLTKANAKVKYLKLLNQGLKHEDLLGSLKYEIALKKMDSIKKNVNQMEYFKGMESYLNQERYLAFIDTYKEPSSVANGEIKSKSRNVTDI
jgi:hypothetical protein